jgi:predicted nucleotidyltransferase
MDPLTPESLAQLEALCRRYGVLRLDLFGSAAAGAFEPGRSDLDFLVEFEPEHSLSAADRYFGLLEDLEELFGCGIDLVMDRAIRNRYFRAEVDRTRKPLYAA